MKKIDLSLIVLFCIVYSIFPVLTLERSPTWDPLVWYGLYHYFSEAIQNNSLALWNFYMHAGEPFWPTWGLFRNIDPLNLLFIYFGKIFNLSIFHTYHIQFVLKYLISGIGIFFLFNYIFKNFLISISIYLIFNFYYLTILFWDGAYMTFCWFPFIFLYFLKYLKLPSLKSLSYVLFFSCLMIGAGNYHSILTIFLLLIFLLFEFLINSNFRKKKILFFKDNIFKIIILLFFSILMCSPFILTFFEIKDLVPMARIGDNRILFENLNNVFDVSYEEMMSSNPAIAHPKNIIKSLLLFPFEINNFLPKIILSISIWILIISGFFFQKFRFKLHILILIFICLFISFGNFTPIHKFIITIFPPLGVVRQIHLFNSIFVPFFLLFPLCAGLLFFKKKLGLLFKNKQKINKIFSNILPFLLIIIFCITLINNQYLGFSSQTQSVMKYSPVFNHKPTKIEFLDERKIGMARTPYFLYEPILFKKNVAVQMVPPPKKNKKFFEMPVAKEWKKISDSDLVRSKFPNGNWNDPGKGFRTMFWTKDFYSYYLLAEDDINKFNYIFNLNKKLIKSFDKTIKISEEKFKALIKKCVANQVKKLLDNFVIIEKFNKANIECVHIENTLGIEKDINYKIVESGPNHLNLMIKNNNLKNIIVYDKYQNGWTAKVNGKKVKIIKANGFFKGLDLSDFKERELKIELKYRPVFYYSVIIYIFLCFSGLITIIYFSRSKIRYFNNKID